MPPFHDLAEFLALERVSELQVSPDGRRLVATVSALDESGAKRVDSLWDVDPAGQRDARRLTFSAKGESTPRWLPDGSLLFRSARDGEDDTPSALYLLPPSGEARLIAKRPGGINGYAVARNTPVVVVASPTLPGALDPEADETRRKERKDRKVNAILHEASPVRYWDRDLGPGETRLLVGTVEDDGEVELRDLTPAPGRALDEQGFDISPDGRTVVTSWAVAVEPGFPRPELHLLDVATGQSRVLAAAADAAFDNPVFSPDGKYIACLRVQDSTYDEAPLPVVWVIDLATGEGRAVGAAADLWPSAVLWSADGRALFVTSDDKGHHPIFRVDLATDEVVRITHSGHHTSVTVGPDGNSLFALRDHIDTPPAPVRIDARAADTDGIALRAPGAVTVPGRLEEVSTVVDDGTTVRAWLALPTQASEDEPAPLLLWIHGGPLSSWNSWTWRWNPWVMAARGYAVLLPDPALSTGYGRAMIQRGWGQWGGSPYSDLMAITDEVTKRPDIDEMRTAAMGGSYGGYMANWVAGHTDRFRCIVTHASLWALDQFQGTTDHPAYWAREWGLPLVAPTRYQQWSPHLFADRISSPMLVIHGDKDYRVPIGEGLRLWWDLQRLSVPSKFLYFPDEGHWILKPGNAQVWYETVLAWLADHVLGEEWERPALL